MNNGCNHPCPSSLARQPVCTRLPPSQPSGLLSYHHIDRSRRNSNPLIQMALRAWDLTSDARIGLSLFNPVPQPVSQSGRNPRRRSNHRMVVRSFDRPNPYAVLHLFSEMRSFRLSLPAYHHNPLDADCLLSNGYRNHQTGGCPWLLTSNLYHLPIAPLDLSNPAASVDVRHPT